MAATAAKSNPLGVRGSTWADIQADSADCTIVVTAMNVRQLISADRRSLDCSPVPGCVEFYTMNPAFGCKGNDLSVMLLSAIVSANVPATGITVYLLNEA